MLTKISNNDVLNDGVNQIRTEIKDIEKEGLKLFLTSSLQTHSIPLLHIIHSINKDIPIYFLNTGYHFPETIEFKEELKEQFGFNIQSISSPIERINQKDANGRLMYASEPDYCCYMNKVLPLEPILQKYDVWISGVRGGQSSFRANLNKFENGKYNTKRYHPIIDWTSKMIFDYRKVFNLPAHPLEEKGYFSIGCMPCTRKLDPNSDPREMRWFGMNKTECGLHTETIEKK
ncbi:phosphoadenylyl-sulfate reductase [Gelidibacter japonicus]|uniref:phosphoadenylyl-sulfate reductase n=1 Tax=Gelidibacter japonicus TaxID=1962232 RepID=UPI003A9404AE